MRYRVAPKSYQRQLSWPVVWFMRRLPNCNHVSTLACFSHSHLALNYAEQYDFISLAVPVGIYSPPYRPPIA